MIFSREFRFACIYNKWHDATKNVIDFQKVDTMALTLNRFQPDKTRNIQTGFQVDGNSRIYRIWHINALLRPTVDKICYFFYVFALYITIYRYLSRVGNNR